MRNVFFTAMLCLITMGMQAQHWCASDHYFDQQVAENPNLLVERQAMVEAIHQGIALNGASREGEKQIIPTVVHVIWAECEDDISLAQVQDGLRIVNEDLNRTNLDAADTREIFQEIAADSDIELRLARIDPDGNPTDGVVRIQSNQSLDANNAVKSLSLWPADRYFNIWIVRNITNFTGGAGTILGYAQFPGSGSWNSYGVVIRHDAVGTIGTSTADGRTFTHEVGHCLNLYHTFQSGCGGNCTNSGDFICDTPPVSESSQSCSFSFNTCGNDANGSSVFTSNVPDMIENYMSYNDCQNLFTEGQKDVMKATLDNVSVLVDLTSQENLEATGVVGLVEADFRTERSVYCVGTPVQFSNQTSYDATDFNWTFTGDAAPNASTVESPSITFDEPGVKDISLEAASGSASVSTTSNSKFLVVDRIGQYIPFTDDMEDESFLPTGQWFPVNIDLDDHEWKLNTSVAFSGNKSLQMENHGSCGNRVDELISQSLDFSTLSNATVSFRIAYAQRSAADNDFVRTYISTDCGETWDLIWVQGGSSLAGATAPQDAPFLPLALADWEELSFNITNPNYMQEGVLLKFSFIGRGGNNLFFDDFSIDGTFNGEILQVAPVNGKQGLPDSVTLDWKAVRGVDSYEYHLDKTPDFNSAALIAGSTQYINDLPINQDTEFKASGLDLNTTYYWRVRYVDAGTTSDWSETWSFNISESGVGIRDLATQSLRIYPNPATDVVNVVSDETLLNAALIDISGRVVRQWGNATTLNVSGLESGVYTLTVRTATGFSSERLVIR